MSRRKGQSCGPYTKTCNQYKGAHGLTDRQIEVLKAIASMDMCYKQIGIAMGLSLQGLISHKLNICRRLRIKDRTGLIHFALARGLVRNLYVDEPNG